MDLLNGFREKDFLEQIAVLGALEKGLDPASAEALFAYYLDPLGDDAVDTMVRNTLRTVLLANEDEILRGLASDDAKIRGFCVGMAGDKGLAAAGPLLMKLAADADDADTLADVLTAMGRIKSPEFLGTFRNFTDHEDDIIAGLSIRMLGELGDEASVGMLSGLVIDGEESEICDVRVYNAIGALGLLGTDAAIDFLVEKIHHKNPTARRVVHQAFLDIGADCVDKVAKALASEDRDDRIMACNVLGFIGDKAGASFILQAFDKGLLEEINLRFAAFEALGAIPNMTSLVTLIDALGSEEDEIVLMAVVTGLESQMHPAVAKKVADTIHADLEEKGGQGDKVIHAIVSAKAVKLFTAVFDDQKLVRIILARVAASNDPEAIEAFKHACEGMDDETAVACAAMLDGAAVSEKQGAILAVDDSTAMRNFYRTAGAELGYEVTTAEHGRAALDHLELGASFDVMVVDMNMPVMDGIEFTRMARAMDAFMDTPIIMATTESTKSQAALARKAGVTTFLKKPFTADVLSHKLKHVLEMNS